MLLSIDAATDRGLVRARNEDAMVIGGFMTNAPRTAMRLHLHERDQTTTLAVIDGMGGHAAGDRAARIVAQTIAERAEVLHEPEQLAETLLRAHEAVEEEASATAGTAGMGATVAGVVFRPNRPALVFNIGDSRVFEVIDGCLVQVSTDDSPPPPPGMPEGARIVTITQAIGAGRPAAAPHITEVDVEDGSCLLLCSDGLTDYTTLDALEHILTRPGGGARALCDAALQGGGGDNVSVILAGLTA